MHTISVGGRTRLCRSCAGRFYLLAPFCCGQFVAIPSSAGQYRIERYREQSHAGAVVALPRLEARASRRPVDAPLWVPLPLP